MFLLVFHFLSVPTEVRLLKREYFNQWYKLGPYYCAMICAKMPFQIFLALIYLTMIYLMSSQPLELSRIVMLYAVSFLIAMNSDSFGVLIASRLSIVVSVRSSFLFRIRNCISLDIEYLTFPLKAISISP